MAIRHDIAEKLFTLETKNTSYQMKVDDYGFLLHLYYGEKIEGNMDYLLTYYDRGFCGNPYDAGTDRTYSMDVLPQEFPCLGNGDYRTPALIIKNADGSYSCDLRYKSYRVFSGKYGIDGLPAVYADEDTVLDDENRVETLEIVMEDACTGIQAVLKYGVLPEIDVITRQVQIRNYGKTEVSIEKLQSACLDFVTGDYDLLTFHGRHAMERNLQREAVAHGCKKIGSMRGTSSHQYNPMMILAEPQTNEDAGNCYSMSFVYSGGFQGEVEQDQFNQTRMIMGLQEEMFSYPLDVQDVLDAPEVIMTFSKNGLNKLSQNLHTCIRNHICRGKYKNEIRPILVNSWEAAYFDFNGDTIYQLAKQAKEVGVEMVVMDDGWFGKRDDDYSGLGDWFVNEKKLGCSLGSLIEKINGIGMKFGIWVEPEMVSMDSDLYRAHPDWALTIPGRNPNRSRYQLVLDFSRKEVVDAIYNDICKVLDMGNIEYLKWDMNRSLADVYSAVTDNQGKVMYDYVMGLYDFLERLGNRYPDLLIEGCSGGGGRFDAGMLYYTPQIWCSDNTDAINRVEIQYGTSFGYPTSAMGAHVSAVPNHQTGRTVPLCTRSVVAMAGSFGYELDLGKLSEGEKEEIRQENRKFRKYASLIQQGIYYRLSNPQTDAVGAWEVVNEEKTEALVSVVMLEKYANAAVSYVKVKGLRADAQYLEENSGKRYSGSALMAIGLPLPVEPGEYLAYQMHFISL
ncbi:MAG: alpha-galactosidase [Lachnospiraceae bacterium]|nr:alpha-galactosidase [Lachnospiraceae bacterium]MDD3617612.1 alpha-galactosidase [Lachnospiraceae bacterium]